MLFNMVYLLPYFYASKMKNEDQSKGQWLAHALNIIPSNEISSEIDGALGGYHIQLQKFKQPLEGSKDKLFCCHLVVIWIAIALGTIIPV